MLISLLYYTVEICKGGGIGPLIQLIEEDGAIFGTKEKRR